MSTAAKRGASVTTAGATAAADTSAPLVRLLMLHEGWRAKPYLDTTGHWSIGFGRNLTDVGISRAEGFVLLASDRQRATDALDLVAPWWHALDEVRQAVLVDLAFNMGAATLKTFRRTLAAFELGDYIGAAAGLRNSKWARQVGRRADRLIQMTVSGEWPAEVLR